MLVHKQRSFLGHYRVITTLNLICEALNHIAKSCMYLVSPEDTTEIGGGGPIQHDKCSGSHFFGAFKAMFWIASSISIALFVGRLS